MQLFKNNVTSMVLAIVVMNNTNIIGFQDDLLIQTRLSDENLIRTNLHKQNKKASLESYATIQNFFVRKCFLMNTPSSAAKIGCTRL